MLSHCMYSVCMDCSMFCQVQGDWRNTATCFVHLLLQTSMNARMVTMEVAPTNVPILVEATSVHAEVAMNSGGKMKHLEVELVVWSTLMLEGSVKVDYYFNMLFPACLASFLFQSLVSYQQKFTSAPNQHEGLSIKFAASYKLLEKQHISLVNMMLIHW